MGVLGAAAGQTPRALPRPLQELLSLTLISGGSRCSYLWIVPITSVKKGVQQADYWLPGVREGNPALSQQTAGPPQTPSSWPTFWGLQQDSGAASFVISFNKWS